MLVSGRLESEPRKQFNRADCVRCTVRTFIPRPFLLGLSVETRYLADDAYIPPGENFPRLRSLDLAVAQRINQFHDPGVELTDERLQEFDKQKKRARKAWGSTVVSHARAYGLVEALTPEVARERLALGPDIDLAEEVDQKYGGFSFGGWLIFPHRNDNKPILLVPTRDEEGQVSFEVVNLDMLYNKDPEFLRQHIRDYQETFAMHALASSVTYNINLHNIPAAELVPEFMREMTQIADPEQKAKEVQYMQAFLNWMERLGSDYRQIVSHFRQGLSSRISDMRDGRRADIQNYLRHMAGCPAQTEETRNKNVELEHICKSLLSAGQHAASIDPLTDNLVVRVLKDPAPCTFNLERREDRHRKDRERHQKVVDFVTRTKDITNQEQLLQALEQELPEFHATLVRLQKWLGVDFSGRSRFDELISSSANKISFRYGTTDLNQLKEIIREELKIAAYSIKEEFEGVSVDDIGTDKSASLDNPHLGAVLPLLAIKAVQSRAEKKKQDRLMGDRYDKQFQLYQRFTDVLAQSHGEKVRMLDGVLQDITEDRDAIASLKSQTGITDEEVAHLIELTVRKDRDDDFLYPGEELDLRLYTSLFNALVLSKLGVVDMHSPAFKGLLKSLFPRRPETVWENL